MELREKGTYALVIELENDRTAEIGALGEKQLENGFYVYIGSAFSQSGLKRLENHVKILEGEKQRSTWHIDYLTSLDESCFVKAFVTPEKIECELASRLNMESIDGFGCSDCSCRSHLFFSSDLKHLEKQLESRLERIESDYSVWEKL